MSIAVQGRGTRSRAIEHVAQVRGVRNGAQSGVDPEISFRGREGSHRKIQLNLTF